MADSDRIVKTIELNFSPARVWSALTDYREFGQWFKVRLESSFAVGKETRGNITYPGYEHIIMTIDVATMEREKLFSFRWHPYAIDPNIDYSSETPTLVEFQIVPTGNGTKLTVIESGFESIPAARREEALRMNSGGWSEQIKNIHAHLQQVV